MVRKEQTQKSQTHAFHLLKIETKMEVPHKITGKTLLESELDEVCNFFDSEENATPDPLYAAAPEMLELAKMILQAEREASFGQYSCGLLDCKDNDGIHYQSEFLAGALNRLAELVDKIEVNPADLDEF